MVDPDPTTIPGAVIHPTHGSDGDAARASISAVIPPLPEVPNDPESPGPVPVRTEAADPLAACGLLIELARALHRAGTPTDRIEGLLDEAAERAGVRGVFFVGPTTIMVSFEGVPEIGSRIVRVDSTDLDLGRMHALGAVVDAIGPSSREIAAAQRALDEVLAAPPPFGIAATRLAFVGASAAAAVFLGASSAGALVAAGLGGLVAFGLEAAATRPRLGRAFLLLAALVSAAIAGVGSRVLGLDAAAIAMAGLIVLLPGLSLTLSMRELAARHLVSGSSHLMGTLADFLAIAFGLAIGDRLVDMVWHVAGQVGLAFPVTSVPWPELPPNWIFAAVAVAPVTFVVLLRVPPRSTVLVTIVALLGFTAATLTGRTDPLLAPMVGGAMVGLSANAFSRRTGVPASVYAVPGIMLLVPGALGIRSLGSFMFGEDTVGALDTAIRTVFVGAAIASGLLAANALLPPRGV